MRYLFLLLLLVLSGCAADWEEPVNPPDLVSEEADPSKPAEGPSKPSGPDLCAPLHKVIEVNGEEFLMEIPVECRVMEPVDIDWGGDYNGLPEANKPGDYHEQQFEDHNSFR